MERVLVTVCVQEEDMPLYDEDTKHTRFFTYLKEDEHLLPSEWVILDAKEERY